jgi:hypothetical protein
MPLWIRDGGSWKSVVKLWVRDAGAWKVVSQAWIRDAGTWKSTFIDALNEVVATLSESEWITVPDDDWRGRVQYSVGNGTESVKEEYDAGSGFVSLGYVNVTPGSTGNISQWSAPVPFSTSFITFRLTPNTANGGGGADGTAVTRAVDRPT